MKQYKRENLGLDDISDDIFVGRERQDIECDDLVACNNACLFCVLSYYHKGCNTWFCSLEPERKIHPNSHLDCDAFENAAEQVIRKLYQKITDREYEDMCERDELKDLETEQSIWDEYNSINETIL